MPGSMQQKFLLAIRDFLYSLLALGLIKKGREGRTDSVFNVALAQLHTGIKAGPAVLWFF